MTLVVEQFDDVTRWRMSSSAGRAFGIGVSAYVYRGVMIDTGFHREGAALMRAAAAAALRGAVVTHWHEDHAGNVEALARRGIPLMMRQDTESILRLRPNIQLYRRAVWGRPIRLEAAPTGFDAPDFQCIHLPGHSADHQVVWFPETRTLFSGDLWLGVKSRVYHVDEDPYTIVESLRRAAALNPVRMFDAHRGLVRDPTAALVARADWLTATLSEIERRIGLGASDRAIVRDVLGGEEAVAWLSLFEYSRRNLVRAVRRRIGA